MPIEEKINTNEEVIGTKPEDVHEDPHIDHIDHIDDDDKEITHDDDHDYLDDNIVNNVTAQGGRHFGKRNNKKFGRRHKKDKKGK